MVLVPPECVVRDHSPPYASTLSPYVCETGNIVIICAEPLTRSFAASRQGSGEKKGRRRGKKKKKKNH